MRREHRGKVSPPQASTPDSAAFRKWRDNKQAAFPCPASEQWGSGFGGYGLGLISDGEASRERIRTIMRDICEREKLK